MPDEENFNAGCCQKCGRLMKAEYMIQYFDKEGQLFDLICYVCNAKRMDVKEDG
jgi:hypothetical protein